MRQYSHDRLMEMGTVEEERWRIRHRDHYLALAEEAHEKRFTAESPDLMGALEPEYDNCRAALDFCESYSDAESHLRLAGSLWWFWYLRGYLQEGREWLDRALTRSDGQDHTCPRALALNGAGNLARAQADLDAARPLLEQSAEIWREQRQGFQLALVLNNLGTTEQDSGHFESARSYYGESLESMRELGNAGGLALVLSNSGWAAYCANDRVAARDKLEEAIALCRESGNQFVLDIALGNLAYIATVEGKDAEARELYREVLDLQAASSNDYNFLRTLESVAELAANMDLPQNGIRLFAAAAAMRERGGMPVPPSERVIHDRIMPLLRAPVSAEAFAEDWELGFDMSVEEALALAQEIL